MVRFPNSECMMLYLKFKDSVESGELLLQNHHRSFPRHGKHLFSISGKTNSTLLKPGPGNRTPVLDPWKHHPLRQAGVGMI